MRGYNLADCFDLVSETIGEREALIQGPRRLSWAEVGRRVRNVAAWMKARGASHQGKVAVYTYNHPAYMEGVYAAMKAGLVPANVNYRYREEELRYLLDNADAEIVIVHEEFVPLLARVAPQLPQLKGVLVVADGDAAPAINAPIPRPSPAPTTTRPSPPPTCPSQRWSARPTTICSSTPAAPPACRRA